VKGPVEMALGSSAASSPLDFAAEADRGRCGALKDYWYVACLSQELGRTRPLARTIFGVPLALFRDEHGRPVAVLDRCLHRNAALSAGAVIGGKLACAYHGWVYDHQGRCVEIPSLGPRQVGGAPSGAGGIGSPSQAGCLPRWPTEERDGLVFVLPSGARAARRPPFATPHHGEPGWIVYYMVTRFPNGVTNLVENFMDVPHTAFVHRGWFRTRGDRAIPATVRSSDEEVLVTYEEGDRVAGAGRLFNLSGAPAEHTDAFYAPHVTRVDYRFGQTASFVITSQITPVGPLDAWVYTSISYRLASGAAGRLAAQVVRPFLRWYTTRVIAQDVAIMDVQKRGLTHAPGGGVFRSTEADVIHDEIERWRGWLREGAPAAERPSPRETRIRFYV